MEKYESQLQPGTISADYELTSLIAVGGTCEVWAVRHRHRPGAYAAKILRHDMLDLAPRIQREFEVLTAFRTRGVIKTHDIAVTRDGRPLIVLEAIPNGTMLVDMLRVRRGLQRRQRAMSPSRCWELFEDVLYALERMAVGGAVHRDIKPANLALERGKLVLIDFGLARVLHLPGMTTCTTPGFTPGYAAPEQEVALIHADHRSDCQSICKVLIECLVGYRWKNFQLPGGVSDLPKLSRTLAGGPLVMGRESSAEDGVVVPLRLRMVLLRALAKKADTRPSISEVSAALREAALLDGDSEGATRLASSAPPHPPEDGTNAPRRAGQRTLQWRRYCVRVLASTAIGAAAGAMLMWLIL